MIDVLTISTSDKFSESGETMLMKITMCLMSIHNIKKCLLDFFGEDAVVYKKNY